MPFDIAFPDSFDAVDQEHQTKNSLNEETRPRQRQRLAP